MIISISAFAALAAVGLTVFAYRTGRSLFSIRDASSVFIFIPIGFAALAVMKTNVWLALLAAFLVVCGWIYGVSTTPASSESGNSKIG